MFNSQCRMADGRLSAHRCFVWAILSPAEMSGLRLSLRGCQREGKGPGTGKLQMTSTKPACRQAGLKQGPKSQTANSKPGRRQVSVLGLLFGTCYLELGICLIFDAWDLELPGTDCPAPGTSSRPLFSNCGLLNFPLEADKAINASSYATGARAIRMEPPTLNSEEPDYRARLRRRRRSPAAPPSSSRQLVGSGTSGTIASPSPVPMSQSVSALWFQW